jgi:sarcosine oxidase delta subunit
MTKLSQMSAKKMNATPVVRHDLIQCPFCGASPEIEYWHGGGPNKRMISCRSDDCHVNPMVTGETEREAIERWERRA